MKRITLMLLRSFFLMPYYFYMVVIKYRNTKKYSIKERYDWLHKTIPSVNRRGRVTILCSGLEHLPKENGYIFFPNHQGMYDVLSFIQTTDQPFAIIMKKETEHIPFLHSIARMLGAEYMDREDIRQSVGIIHKMSKRVLEGENFIIFAEGTRSKHGNHVGSFKHGSFKSAMYAKCPIVPVALIDCYKAFDTGSAKPVTIQIHYMEPIYYNDYHGLKSAEIAELVQNRIQQKIRDVLEEQGRPLEDLIIPMTADTVQPK